MKVYDFCFAPDGIDACAKWFLVAVGQSERDGRLFHRLSKFANRHGCYLMPHESFFMAKCARQAFPYSDMPVWEWHVEYLSVRQLVWLIDRKGVAAVSPRVLAPVARQIGAKNKVSDFLVHAVFAGGCMADGSNAHASIVKNLSFH